MSKFTFDYRITPAETQIVKAFAIAAMLIHHLFYEHPEYGMITHSVGIAGKICVALFVFLSGYGMATTFPKNICGCLNTVKAFFFFLGKRYAKFFLNYWVVFFVTVPIGIFCFGRTLETAYGENANILVCFIKDMLGQQGFDSYNITWWFNELILALWLLFPLFYYAMKNGFWAVGILFFFFINPGDILYVFELIANCLSIYALPFCLGIAMALHLERINKILNMVPLRVVLYGSITATFCLFFLRGVPLVPSFSYFRVDPFLTVALVLAVISTCRATKLKFTPLQYVGKHSMNMYLTHTYILGYFFGEYVFELKFPIVMFVIVFAASLLVSIAFETVKGKVGFYQLQNWIVSFLSRQIPSAHN